MLVKRGFSYKTDTEESLGQLISSAKREKYYDIHKELFTELEKDIEHSLDQDLFQFRSEISDMIEDEIIGRYFYEEGAIAWTLKKDDQIKKAVEIFNNKEEYSSILSGKSGSILITRKAEEPVVDNNRSVSLKNQEPV
jgi:carboxyl-terminal processing protease